jgi:ribonuclease PH
MAMELISIDGLRGDGRRPTELRKICCEIGNVPHADGSATVSMGVSKVSHMEPRFDAL